jgi:hypothetical protein
MTARRMNLFQMGRFPQYLTPPDATSGVFAACVWKARGLLKRFNSKRNMDMAGVRQAANRVEPREEARFCDDIADGVPKGAKAAVAIGCVIRAVDGSL